MARIIYPDIYIREHREVIPSGSRNGKTIFSFKLMTSLRKERQGRWYLCNFTKSWMGEELSDVHKQSIINLFHREIYQFLIVGVVVPEIGGFGGQPVFELDEDQRSEADRLTELLKF